MLNLKLKSTGALLMHNGRIYLGGFEADNAMCREVAALALLWAIGELQAELVALIHQPGGTGKTRTDLPQEVEEALMSNGPHQPQA
jgi:hypothetical protein